MKWMEKWECVLRGIIIVEGLNLGQPSVLFLISSNMINFLSVEDDDVRNNECRCVVGF